MADLPDVASVKSAYKRYIVTLHPDRVQASGDTERIFLANRIFAAMTEAFNEFKRENGIKWMLAMQVSVQIERAELARSNWLKDVLRVFKRWIIIIRRKNAHKTLEGGSVQLGIDAKTKDVKASFA